MSKRPQTVLFETARAHFWASAFLNDSTPSGNGDFGQGEVFEQASKRTQAAYPPKQSSEQFHCSCTVRLTSNKRVMRTSGLLPSAPSFGLNQQTSGRTIGNDLAIARRQFKHQSSREPRSADLIMRDVCDAAGRLGQRPISSGTRHTASLRTPPARS
jgi:hypothetical protein